MGQTWTRWFNGDSSTRMRSHCGLVPSFVSSTFTIRIMWKRYWHQQVRGCFFFFYFSSFCLKPFRNIRKSSPFFHPEPKDDLAYRFIESWIGKILLSQLVNECRCSSVTTSLCVSIFRRRFISVSRPEMVSTQTAPDPGFPLWRTETVREADVRLSWNDAGTYRTRSPSKYLSIEVVGCRQQVSDLS